MNSQLRVRFWIEAALTGASGLLLALTLIWRDWIEIIFRVEPDEGSGALEWLIVFALLALTLTFALMTGAEWRRRAMAH